MPTFRAGFADPLEELREDFDRLWSTSPWTTLAAAPPRQGRESERATGGFPAVNIAETDDSITIEAELPGLDVGDVDISVTGEDLLIKGSRPDHSGTEVPGTAAPETGSIAGESDSTKNGDQRAERERAERETVRPSAQPTVTWHRRERGSGAFERRITLPVAVDSSRVEARLVDGVLTVMCPKAAEAQPHRVSVRSA